MHQEGVWVLVGRPQDGRHCLADLIGDAGSVDDCRTARAIACSWPAAMYACGEAARIGNSARVVAWRARPAPEATEAMASGSADGKRLGNGPAVTRPTMRAIAATIASIGPAGIHAVMRTRHRAQDPRDLPQGLGRILGEDHAEDREHHVGGVIVDGEGV